MELLRLELHILIPMGLLVTITRIPLPIPPIGGLIPRNRHQNRMGNYSVASIRTQAVEAGDIGGHPQGTGTVIE